VGPKQGLDTLAQMQVDSARVGQKGGTFGWRKGDGSIEDGFDRVMVWIGSLAVHRLAL
jgi:hypothetical protein